MTDCVIIWWADQINTWFPLVKQSFDKHRTELDIISMTLKKLGTLCSPGVQYALEIVNQPKSESKLSMRNFHFQEGGFNYSCEFMCLKWYEFICTNWWLIHTGVLQYWHMFYMYQENILIIYLPSPAVQRDTAFQPSLANIRLKSLRDFADNKNVLLWEKRLWSLPDLHVLHCLAVLSLSCVGSSPKYKHVTYFVDKCSSIQAFYQHSFMITC